MSTWPPDLSPRHAGSTRFITSREREGFSALQRGEVKIIAVDDRRGRLDSERYYRVGGQGEDRIHFERVSSDDVGTMGRIKQAIVDFLADQQGERFTPRQIPDSKGVTGDSKTIRKALDMLASADSHVHREENPKRKDSSVYFFDSGGLSIDGEPMVRAQAC